MIGDFLYNLLSSNHQYFVVFIIKCLIHGVGDGCFLYLQGVG